MKIRKGLIQLLLFAVFAIASLCGLAACGNPAAEISIGRNDMPRLTYVEGQELDLSSGMLTVVYEDGKVETLPLNSDGISLSGYDKNAPGKQTVTVTYQKLTTTFDVTLIARVSVDNPQTVYYEGEQLNTARGRLIIAKDDATTYSVPFSDSAVTFDGFDSSAPVAEQTVTAIYKAENNAEYKGKFTVSIYTTANAVFTPPRKTDYRSHEEFRVNGAYITYSNGNPTYDKSVEVTPDMITGLDFSLVTQENSPMEQTAKVVYGNNEFTFKVTITFSDVTRLQNLLKEYKFEWTEPEVPEISKEQGERAIECAKIYSGLSSAEVLYIDQTAIEAAARTAAAYASGLWSAQEQICEKTFLLKDGEFAYVLYSYEDTKQAAGIVSDENNALNLYAEFMKVMTETFPDLTVGGVAMSEYLSKAKSYLQFRDEIESTLNFTLSLYDCLKDVPEEWGDLTAYAADIDAARDLITCEEFGTSAYRDLFTQLSTWRNNDDLYDILYSYYTAQEDSESIEKLKNLVLPSALNEIYGYLLGAIIEYSSIFVGTDGGYATDSTFLVYDMRNANEAKQKVLSGEDEWIISLYQTLTFDNILVDSEGQSLPSTFDDLFRFVEVFGYYNAIGGTLDDSALVALWDSYLELLVTADEDLATSMKAFVEQLTSLSPAQQMSFLLSVNVHYDSYEKLSLDTDVNYTFLIRMLKGYYSEVFSEEEFGLFRNLLLAIESYAHIGDRTGAAKDFLSYLSEITAGYGAEGENVAFRENFGAVYEKYLKIAALYDENGNLLSQPVVDEEWQAVLDALADEIKNTMQEFDLIFSQTEETSESSFVRLYASYEAARAYAERILNQAPDAVKDAYYYKTYRFLKKYSWTLDYAMTVEEKSIGVIGYAQLTFAGQSLWEVIKDDAELRSFLAKSVEIVRTDASNASSVSPEDAAELMRSFLTLSYRNKILFVELQDIDENHSYYYDGISAVFGKLFVHEDTLNAATEALLKVEQAFVEYWSYTKFGEEDYDQEEFETALSELNSAMETLNAALEDLSSEETQTFNGYFAEIVAYYQSAYAEVSVE